jgi:hypothetical protein
MPTTAHPAAATPQQQAPHHPWPFAPLTPQQQRERSRLERRLRLECLPKFPERLS